MQVCTNVSCMLRGGNKILEHVERKLEIGHKEVTKDGIFSLEEVECIGACTGAPAMQVNYDFYENLTPEALDQIIDGLDHGQKPAPVVRASGSVHPRNAGEVVAISRRFGITNSNKLDVYLKNDGYQALEKALKQMTTEQVIDEVKKSGLARTRRRGISHRHEVEFCSEGYS